MPRQEFNDFQKEVNEGVEAFWQAAQAKRGRVMGSREVMLLAAYISGMTEGIMELQGALNYKDDMLAAYINEYGDSLFVELTSPVVEGEVVEPEQPYDDDAAEAYMKEVYDDAETELSDTEGQETQADGLDSSKQEEE